MTVRTFISLLLALILGLTSQAMAVTRGAAAASGEMVICDGSGTYTLYVDVEGQPTAAPHLCPDCVISQVVDVWVPKVNAPWIWVAIDHPQPVIAQNVVAPLRQGHPSRAPPVFV